MLSQALAMHSLSILARSSQEMSWLMSASRSGSLSQEILKPVGLNTRQDVHSVTPEEPSTTMSSGKMAKTSFSKPPEELDSMG